MVLYVFVLDLNIGNGDGLNLIELDYLGDMYVNGSEL